MHSKISIWIAEEVEMKQDRMLMVTVHRQESNGHGATNSGDGVTNCGGDRRVVKFRNMERYWY